jgi:DNA-binding transcriptional MerR regulator
MIIAMKQGNTEGLLKISEVAEAAGTSISTVKFYVKEGLVEIARKTGKNMAYYSPESVERVKLIRTLQSEKYYPLAVIKHLLKNGGAASEVELFDTINKVDFSDYYELIPVFEAAKEVGLKKSDAEALIRAGLISTTNSGHTRMCCRGDCRVMKLVKIRMDAGIPLPQTVKTFSMYEMHLRETTQSDIDSLVADGILKKNLGTEDIMNIINVSDETLDTFISMKRYAMNAALGSVYVDMTIRLLSVLKKYGKGVREILGELKYFAAAEDLEKALSGQKTNDRSLFVYGEMLRLDGTGLAKTLSVLHKAGTHFEKPEPESGNAVSNMTASALRLGWLSFAPEAFGYSSIAAREEFVQNTSDKTFVESVLRLLDELQNAK